MDLKNDHELMNTQRKLRKLEALYEEDANETGGDEDLREAEMESLKRQINRLKEEIARYQARQPAAK
ncbi:MAG TPA: hypothetical protein VFW73_09585 [Lacipirellulaceae bacterium]|nr:hypothetical protein [Lacipirellulaceae bacterium]